MAGVEANGTSVEGSHWAGKESVSWDRETIGRFNVVVIATNHASVNYQELADWQPRIVDTRNAMAAARFHSDRCGRLSRMRTINAKPTEGDGQLPSGR